MAEGVLYLVGVPIGNFGDITFRAVETLKKADVIAAEDTRKAQKLLAHFAIKPEKLVAHHAHNEAQSSAGLLEMLAKGQDVALITDAGMPTVSDPGYHMVSATRKAGFDVVVVPGVSAVSTAVAVSGLAAEDFRFVGFLPRKKGAQDKVLSQLKASACTLVLFESPRRTLETLQALLAHFGNREACLCRELTKTHEEIVPATLEHLFATLGNREKILGEVTLVVAGATAAENTITAPALEELILSGLEEGISPKSLRDSLSSRYGLRKKDVYEKIISLKSL